LNLLVRIVAAAFSPFWSDDFNARDFVRSAVAQSTSVLQRLQGALQTVDQALRNLVIIFYF
jgi:hypothetical protein